MSTPAASNVIPDRIAEALRRFPPFSMFAPEDVHALAENAAVRILGPGQQIWQQGDKPGDELFFLAQGRVEYHWQQNERSEMVDVRDVGDVLGLTALLEGKALRVTAQVIEESIFYCVPWEQLRKLLTANDEARNYARRHLFWTTRVGGHVTITPDSDRTITGRTKNILQAHLDGAQIIRPRPAHRLLSCLPEDPIEKVAQLMNARRVKSILVVTPALHPLGIVTSSNLVKHVILGTIPKSAPVERIMVSPVITVSAGSSATAAILLMLRERIGQVCVTADGTTDSPALDVCSEKDLLTQSGNHPAGLLREIRHARSDARFRELCDDIEQIVLSYLEAGVSAIFVGQICAELYDELGQRFLELAQDELAAEGIKLPPNDWAWMCVGSDGRREQILRTDMDNAFVFASSGSPVDDEQARTIFLQFTARVVEKLVACGFSRCQGGVMASNPNWCKTDSEWIEELENMGLFPAPDKMLRAIVLYDLRFVAGNEALALRVRDHVFSSVGSSEAMQRRLAELVVETPPPLNFFGKFVVEKRGGRAGEFDIKARGLAPLRDAARALALKHQLTRHYSTGGRWLDLQRNVPGLAEIAGLARDGYDTLLRVRTLTGLRRGDAGRFIEPDALTKLERAQLANVFDVQRMVQDVVRTQFRLEIRR